MRNPISFSLFATGMLFCSVSFSQPNLVVNPGAETAVVAPWIIDIGGNSCSGGSNWRMPGPQEDNYPAPHNGDYFFNPGCKVRNTPQYRLYQDVDVSSYAAYIDAGMQSFDFTIWMSVWSQSPPDITRTVVKYLSSSNATLSTYDTGEMADKDVWTKYQDTRVAPVGTRKIRITLLGSAKNGTAVDAYFDDISLRAISILPITLSSFNVVINKDRILANWSTASESNSARFILQRSPDAINWSKVASVSGAGNSDVLRNYQAADNAPLSGRSFYRLVLIDKDGSYSYSNVESVNNLFAGSDLRLFPNPSSSVIFIEGDNISSYKLLIFNSLGVNVTSLVRISNEGQSKMRVDISRLQAGTYFAKEGEKRIAFSKQ